MLPSTLCTEADQIYAMVNELPHEREVAVRCFVQGKIEEQVTRHPVLQQFADKLMDFKFSQAPLEMWHEQFKLYESSEDFASYIRSLQTLREAVSDDKMVALLANQIRNAKLEGRDD